MTEETTTTALGLRTFAGFDAPTYKALREAIAPKATEAEFKAHLLICQRYGLSPVGGQTHFVKRRVYDRDTRQWKEAFSTQVGIDGYRSMAESTGLYEGPAGEPEFIYEEDGEWTDKVYLDKIPVAARVGVYRKGRREPIRARAYYRHYVQTVRDRTKAEGGEEREVLKPNPVWAQRPHPQLAKCAEALALRMAFPRELGGIHTREEMAHADAAPSHEEAPPREPERLEPPKGRESAPRVGPGTRRERRSAPPEGQDGDPGSGGEAAVAASAEVIEGEIAAVEPEPDASVAEAGDDEVADAPSNEELEAMVASGQPAQQQPLIP